MAKTREVSSQEIREEIDRIVDKYRDNVDRATLAAAFADRSDMILREDTWPSEQANIDEAVKDGLTAVRRPTEAEMKNAAAQQEAAKFADQRKIPDDYTDVNVAKQVEDDLQKPEAERKTGDPGDRTKEDQFGNPVAGGPKGSSDKDGKRK